MDHLTASQERWARALGELKAQTTRATFDTWLRASRVIDAGEDHIQVSVRHQFAVDWLDKRLRPLIERTVNRVFGHEMEVKFTCQGWAPAHPPPVGGGPDPVADPDPEGIVEAVREERVTVSESGPVLQWTDFYIKVKVSFRKAALRRLKGAPLSVFFCLSLHVDRDSVASPGIQAIMRETGYSRSVVCNALAFLVDLGLVTQRKRQSGPDEYIVNGYAWFGKQPAPSLWEEKVP